VGLQLFASRTASAYGDSSIEVNITKPVPEWDGQDVVVALEEDAALTDGEVQQRIGHCTQRPNE